MGVQQCYSQSETETARIPETRERKDYKKSSNVDLQRCCQEFQEKHCKGIQDKLTSKMNTKERIEDLEYGGGGRETMVNVCIKEQDTHMPEFPKVAFKIKLSRS